MIERPVSRQPMPEHATRVFKGKIFDIYQWQQELFDGTTTVFEKAKRAQDSVSVIPVLPDGRFVITYDEQPGREPLVTFPGGQIEEGELPELAAARELMEETGYKTDALAYWYGFQPETKIDYAIYVFIAHNAMIGGEAHTDAGERITVRTVSLDELIELSQQSNFQNTELRSTLLEARYNPEARTELIKRFS